MKKIVFNIFIGLIMLILLSGVAMSQNPDDESQIKSLVDHYFRLKYESQHTLNQQDFSDIVSDTKIAQEFLQDETDKREIELFNARINGLRYLEYKYSLEFETIKIDKQTETAVVRVIEGHDVVFEVTSQVTSSMHNLEHIITLHKVKSGWKIVKDVYEDELRRFINDSGLSKEQIIEKIRLQKEEEKATSSKSNINTLFLKNILLEEQSMHMSGTWHGFYNRTATVNYAHQYALSPNPDYHNFSSDGGDCTNFTSQVIHAGGAPMDSIGNYQWHYYSLYDRSPAWTDVDLHYAYLVNNTWTGPVGMDSSIYGVDRGDIIQVNLIGDSSAYEHGLVVVAAYWPRYEYNVLVAAHTVDRDNHPLSYYSWADKRYIHIRGYYD